MTEHHGPNNQHTTRHQNRDDLLLSPRRPHRLDELQNASNVRVNTLVPVADSVSQCLEQTLVLLALMQSARELKTPVQSRSHCSDALVGVWVVPRHQRLIRARKAPHSHALDGALSYNGAVDRIRVRNLSNTLVAKLPFDASPELHTLLPILQPAAPPALANDGDAVVEATGFPFCDEEGLRELCQIAYVRTIYQISTPNLTKVDRRPHVQHVTNAERQDLEEIYFFHCLPMKQTEDRYAMRDFSTKRSADGREHAQVLLFQQGPEVRAVEKD